VGRLGLGLGLGLGLWLGLALGLQLGIGIGFRRNHSWSSVFTPRRNHSLCLLQKVQICIDPNYPVPDTGYCFRSISLFLCQQEYEKTAGPICMKFFREGVK